MSACTLDIEKLERPNAPFSFAAAPQGTVEKRLTVSRGELVRAIGQELDQRTGQLLVCPSVEIFKTERAKVFGEYSLLLKAASKIILTDTDPMVHQELVQDTLISYEAKVQRQSGEIFGSEVTGEILFSLATLRRTYRLVGQILARPECPQACVADDRDNAKNFSASISWCSIHLDCIMNALDERERRIPLGVLEEILIGLRFSVAAYAHARAGYDFRYVTNPSAPTQWDEEDRYLADLSTRERESLIRE